MVRATSERLPQNPLFSLQTLNAMDNMLQIMLDSHPSHPISSVNNWLQSILEVCLL